MIGTLRAWFRNGECKLDTTVADDFVAGSPIGVSTTGYSLFKAGQAGKVFVGMAMNNKTEVSGALLTNMTVLEPPVLVELTEAVVGELFASVTFAVGDTLYVTTAGTYSNVATGNEEIGIVRGISPLLVKVTK